MKNHGLNQLINEITRPNRKGGSCIDQIMTDSLFIDQKGELNDFVSDHYTIFCVRKTIKERNANITQIVRDYSTFDKNVFENLLTNSNWNNFDIINDPDAQWEIILNHIENILKVMCPYKRVNSRRNKTPWLTPEIYKAIREKKKRL